MGSAARDLGLDPETPLLGYVLRESWIAEKPALAKGLAAASREAKQILATDEAQWDKLRPIMNAADDAEFAALDEQGTDDEDGHLLSVWSGGGRRRRFLRSRGDRARCAVRGSGRCGRLEQSHTGEGESDATRTSL